MRIKRLLLMANIMSIFLAILCAKAVAYNGDVIVYVTYTGECYHRLGCTYLDSQVELSLEEAVQKGYYRCSRCSPPILGEDNAHDTDKYYSYAERQEMQQVEDKKEEKERKQEDQEDEQQKELARQKYILVTYVIALIVGVSVVILVLLARAKMKKEMELHEARCRGEIPGGMPGMPFGTVIGDDGFPTQIGKNGWGPMYTFYVARSGSVFHKVPNCSRGAYYPVHAINIGNRRPCKKCKPVLPDLNWFNSHKDSHKDARSAGRSREEAKQKEKTTIHLPQKADYSLRVKIGVTKNGAPIYKMVYADNPEELRKKAFNAKFPQM